MPPPPPSYVTKWDGGLDIRIYKKLVQCNSTERLISIGENALLKMNPIHEIEACMKPQNI